MAHKTGIYSVEPDSSGMKIVRGEANIRDGYPDYLRDESNMLGSGVEALFFPRSVENIAYAVHEASEKNKSLTVSGGRTGICAGAVPHEGYLISLSPKSSANRPLTATRLRWVPRYRVSSDFRS